MEDNTTKENEEQNQEEIKEDNEQTHEKNEEIEDATNKIENIEENLNEQKEENQNEIIKEEQKENVEENQNENVTNEKNEEKIEEVPNENTKENIEEKQEDMQNEKNEEKIEVIQNEQNEENQNKKIEEEQNKDTEENYKENTEEPQNEKINVDIGEEIKENAEENQQINTVEMLNKQKEEKQNENIEEIQNKIIEINQEENIEKIQEVQNEQIQENEKNYKENIEEVPNEQIKENQKENIIKISEKIDDKQNEKIQLNVKSEVEIKENKNEIKNSQNKLNKKKVQMFGDIKIEIKKNNNNNNNNNNKNNINNNNINNFNNNINNNNININNNINNNNININNINNNNNTNTINIEKNETTPKPIEEHIETSEDKKLNSKKIYIDKTSELNGKTLYHIKGDFLPDDAQVIRRYRDFDLLCTKLNHNWPCILLPPISKKKLFSNTDKKVIDERVYQLQNFLQVSSELPFISQSPEYKLFLNKDITNSDAFQAQMKRLAPYNYKTISENYTKYFSGYKPEKNEELNNDKFSMFMGYVNGFIDRISEYKKKLVVFGDIPKVKIYRDSRFIKHFIDFEKKAMTYFVDNDLSFLYFYNNNAALKDSQEKFAQLINHPFLLLSMWIRLKELEILSMKEILNEYKELLDKKKSYNNKVRELQQKLEEAKSGKIGFLDKIFVKGNVKEKYETELKFQTEQTDYINNIVKIISDYLSVEFYKYFKDLTQNFYYIVRNFFSFY